VRPPAAECFRFSSTSICLALGLAYIAGAVEASGRELHVLDAIAEAPTTRQRYIKGFLVGLPVAELAARIPANIDVVGISVIFTHEWPDGSKRKRGNSGGLRASILHALSGLVESKHESRLQTAFRTGVFSLWHTLRVRFSAPWIDAQEERELLASWDTTYRSIREQLQEQRVLRQSPPDSRSLHESNVIPFLRDDHGSARRLAPQT
jgi:hypothetical protein